MDHHASGLALHGLQLHHVRAKRAVRGMSSNPQQKEESKSQRALIFVEPEATQSIENEILPEDIVAEHDA